MQSHMILFDDPALFNGTVDKFFRVPFLKKDRIKAFVGPLKKMKAKER